jgi:hypothetical protein
MIKLTDILTEALVLFKIEVLIKTSNDENQVYIYNEIRGLKDVVVVTVEQNNFLKTKSNDKHQFALLKMKYLATSDPKEAINRIKTDALVTNKIPGLIQFIPRFNTVEKVGEY